METLTIFCHHENQACPPALSDVRSLCFGTKSDLHVAFDEISDAVFRKPTTTSIVLDGATIEQMMKRAVCKNFREYAQEIFIPYVSTIFQSPSRLSQLCHTSFKSKAWKRSVQMRGHRSSHAQTLAELSPSGHQQDTVVQVCQKLFSSGLTIDWRS
jgi:hypothetical protein